MMSTPKCPGALLPVPLALTVIVLLITGIPATEAIPVFISAIVAYFITHGLGLLGAGSKKEQTRVDERLNSRQQGDEA
jgi:hypothetical protein